MRRAQNSPPDSIELPGYDEVLRREERVRQAAFGPFADVEQIAGIPVRPLTPRALLILEELRNGFVVPFEFESPAEVAGQIAQFLWVLSPSYAIPHGWWHRVWLGIHRRRLLLKIARLSWEDCAKEIHRYLDEAFYDAPRVPEDAPPPGAAATVPWSAMLYDEMIGLGYQWSTKEFLEIPFKQLWQWLRLARHRRNPDEPLVNPSDAWVVQRLAEISRAGI